MRAGEVFCTFDCWTTFNTLPLLQEQSRVFGGAPRPYIYIIQEYEPLFYPMSSTHMLARAAFETDWPCWGVFNSSELYAFFTTQGHRLERSFVFEPKISGSLRPFLNGEAPVKERRILVYGRPSIPRNCFPAVTKGLACWAERHPEFAGWTVVSAGLRHAPITFAPGRAMNSLGKLALEDYAMLLRGSAVGLSLMASPHPSYPPLEMAHFGIRTGDQPVCQQGSLRQPRQHFVDPRRQSRDDRRRSCPGLPRFRGRSGRGLARAQLSPVLPRGGIFRVSR